MLLVGDYGRQEVIGLTENGDVRFRYRHPELVGPCGIAVDGEDNIYVCGNYSHNIHQLSSEAQHIRILPSGNVQKPRCISFQPDSTNFLFTNDSEGDDSNIVRHFTLQ
jgi:hypothetical protein